MVEGLPVFAVSYCIFNLVKYVMEPMFSLKTAHMLYAPVIAIIVALVTIIDLDCVSVRIHVRLQT